MISPPLYSSGRLNKFAPLQALSGLHLTLPRESVSSPSYHYRLPQLPQPLAGSLCRGESSFDDELFAGQNEDIV